MCKTDYIRGTDGNTRYYCRYVLAGGLGATDHLMLTALVGNISCLYLHDIADDHSDNDLGKCGCQLLHGRNKQPHAAKMV
jgi:hypothetical protein